MFDDGRGEQHHRICSAKLNPPFHVSSTEIEKRENSHTQSYNITFILVWMTLGINLYPYSLIVSGSSTKCIYYPFLK